MQAFGGWSYWVDEMRHTIDIYRRLLTVQLRSQLAFRIPFIFDLTATGFITLIEFGALALVMQRFPTIDGWSLSEVAFLYGLVEMGFAFMDMTFSGYDPPFFGRMIRQGTFDQVLLRPIPLPIQILGSAFELRRIGRIAFGIGVFTFALLSNPIQWTVGKLFYLPLIQIGIIAFFGGLFIIGSTITFWTVDSIEFLNIFTYGGSFTISYPMSIYPRWLRQFFTFALPAIFLNYYPALYFLEKPDPFGMPYFVHFLSPLVGITLLALALWFWNFGVRHYQSTGS